MRVLLVKLSSLGDVVHTLPVVQDILAAYPNAQIDWVVEKAFAPLLTQVEGLQRVIVCQLRRWRKSVWSAQTRREWRAFKADLQTEKYDAVIDLQGLTKSAVVARTAILTSSGKRYAMANQTDGSAYEAPTRWVADEQITLEAHIHAVARGRQLAAAALGYTACAAYAASVASADEVAKKVPNYGLKVPSAQLIRAQAAPKNIAFIHGTSRADKQWPLENWVELGQRCLAQGWHITLVHGSMQELATSQTIARRLARQLATQLGSRCTVLPLLALDALTPALGNCVGAIGVDSGVSHLAVALGLQHVQIYNFDTAWRTGPLGNSCQVSVFAQPHPTVDAVWQAWLQTESALP